MNEARTRAGPAGRAILPLAAVLIPLAAAALRAQTPGEPGAAAATYRAAYDEVAALAPLAERSAEVSHLVLTRDAGRLVLERGRLWLLSPVGGRTVGAVFVGEGRFTLTPPHAAEREALRRFADTTTLDAPITSAVLLFADSTPEQLRGLAFGPGPSPTSSADDVRSLVNSLKGEKDGTFDTGVMGPLLNGEASGYFAARLARQRGDPVLFVYDPAVAEAVQLRRPVGRRRWGAEWATVTRFAPAQPLPHSAGVWTYRERVRVPAYRIETRLTEMVSANLDIAASATLDVAANEPVGPWLLFLLHPKLEVDSARWGGGEAAATFKADEDDALWVRAPRRLAAGDSLRLTVHYHGDLIDRYADFFFLAPGADWYPANGQGPDWARFDLTFRSPVRYPLVALGERGDSSLTGRERTTHWTIPQPVPHARFNLGLFETFHVQNEGAPPLDIVWSDDAHRLLRRAAAAEGVMLTEQRNMRGVVANDVSNALKLFGSLFGPSPQSRFTITEIPYNEGVSFPGMIDLSWSTFQASALDGFDEFFRAHEVAHQWWGNGVRPMSYRDAWLSEGLATLCGLWYLQVQRRRTTEYYRFLDQYRTDLGDVRDRTGALTLGWRNSTPDVPAGYQVLIYEKGAWVFQMLRAMFLDLSTLRADRFTALLREYYRTFDGGVAATEDFQNLVERYAGEPMGWFFDEWVRGTGVPSYRVAWTGQPTDDGRWRVRLRVSQSGVPADFQMPVIVSVDLGGQRTARFRVLVRGATGEYTSPLLPAEPRELVFNDLHSVLADVAMERW